jgi:hypothetical protein
MKRFFVFYQRAIKRQGGKAQMSLFSSGNAFAALAASG